MILTVEVYPELRYYYFILLGGGATFCSAAISKCSLTMSNKCFTGSVTECYILCEVHESANSLSVTLVLLIISSFCLRVFNQCLFNPYHLLYRLSHVFHLLDNNLSLTYAMNHWMVQSVHTNALHGSSKLQWLAHNH